MYISRFFLSFNLIQLAPWQTTRVGQLQIQTFVIVVTLSLHSLLSYKGSLQVTDVKSINKYGTLTTI